MMLATNGSLSMPPLARFLHAQQPPQPTCTYNERRYLPVLEQTSDSRCLHTCTGNNANDQGSAKDQGK